MSRSTPCSLLLTLPLLLSASGCAPLQLARPTAPAAGSQTVPGRLIVLYRDSSIPADADRLASAAGARVVAHLQRLGLATLEVSPADEPQTIAALSADPQVAAILHDRYITAPALLLRATALEPSSHASEDTTTSLRDRLLHAPIQPSTTQSAAPSPIPTDSSYNSPQGWAVRQAGGYGDNIPGGPSTGPWNASLGAGVRIAILDTGVDEHHPDIAPNLAYNLSEVDQTALPSPCDDGSPQDQQGHGTWTASLAAGALGSGTGETIGIAPQATLLNIKVLERLPASGVSDPVQACEAGQPGGLLSWVLQGIEDALAQKADIIDLSLGTVVDLSTGEGAGWKAAFDQITYAATQSGAVLIAAAGNDSLNLSSGSLIELPAQARGVLPVVASTNADCAENLTAGATCAPGPITRPFYSNYGTNLDAIAAPGGSYPEGPQEESATGASGWISGACSSGLANTTDGLPANGASFGCFNQGHAAYAQAMGTSASAALVAGAAAILRATHPAWTATQLIDALRSSATPSASLTEPQLNLPAALALP